MPGGPAKEAVEDIRGTAGVAGMELVQILDRVVQTTGQVEKEADRAVPVLRQKGDLRRSARPRMAASAAPPQRPHGQMRPGQPGADRPG